MDYEQELQTHNIKPTANRILILKTLDKYERPFSIKDLEELLVTLDKSSIFRCIKLFAENHLIHEIEDGSGSTKYEHCKSTHTKEHTDLHPHFYCERCKRTICLHDIPMPHVNLNQDYTVHSINYIIKGICDKCND